ncbi:MAG TPA: hypothetical protein PKW33_12875 [Anaerolineaceae bacterium]|nr:hypothetical protein [Anaerolineaceae bacterium]HPN52476.1 hypothetical protein [Anaerolineaceae bacterium]
MTRKIKIALFVLLLLALAAGTLPALARAPQNPAVSSGGGYRLERVVEQPAVQAGGYRLAEFAPLEPALASGGNYRLLAPAAANATGHGCCCSFLPCVIRP